MRTVAFTVAAVLLLPPAQPILAAPPKLAVTEQAAIFKAAQLRKTRRGWESGCDDPSAGAAYQPASVDHYGDVNGDGRPEAVVIEGGSYCYGNTGQAFWLVSKQADGSWKLLYNSSGIATFQKTKGTGGYPDLEVGGPGFCFPVLRWNGRAYVQNRMAYDGKPCRR
ncbi:MAG TPA: hypothetical protein VF475_07240 [Sphingobium sp.]